MSYHTFLKQRCLYFFLHIAHSNVYNFQASIIATWSILRHLLEIQLLVPFCILLTHLCTISKHKVPKCSSTYHLFSWQRLLQQYKQTHMCTVPKHKVLKMFTNMRSVQEARAVAAVQTELESFQAEMQQASLSQRQVGRAAVDAAVQRAQRFVDRTLRLTNFSTLSAYVLGQGPLPVSKSFQGEILGDATRQLTDMVSEHSSWLRENCDRQVRKYRWGQCIGSVPVEQEPVVTALSCFVLQFRSQGARCICQCFICCVLFSMWPWCC